MKRAVRKATKRTSKAKTVIRDSGMKWREVCKLARALPGVEEGTSYGTAAIKVRGKFMLRLREDNESLAVKCGFDERDFRLRADPETFFNTDHYRGYPTVLVHLTKVSPPVMRELLEQTWRFNAPKSLVKRIDLDNTVKRNKPSAKP